MAGTVVGNAMASHFSAEEGLLIVGVTVTVFVLLALAIQYVDVPVFGSVGPYLRFAYVSFLKPHTGKNDGGQQSALESFYSAQV